MTRSQAPWAMLVAALLSSCADDSARLAGGTGSDLPRPVARLLDTSLAPVDAMAWRLWKVVGDSAKPMEQIVNSSGFLVPASGRWIVEAWKDSASAGGFGAAHTVRIQGDLDSCESNLTYIQGMGDSIVGVLKCLDISSPSQGGATKPLGWGYFGRKDTIHQIIRMPTTLAADAWRFAIWMVDTQTVRAPWVDTAQHNASFLVRHPVVRYAPYKGLMDITTGPGLWLFQAWNGDSTKIPQGSTVQWEASLPDSMWVDALELRQCVQKPGFCIGQIGDGEPAATYLRIRR